MRLLHTFKNDRDARLFSAFIKGKGIENSLDITSNTDWGSNDYGTLDCKLWVIDEEDVASADQWLNNFLENPKDPQFQETLPPPPPKVKIKIPTEPKPSTKSSVSKAAGAFTFYLIVFCTIIFFASEASKRPLETPPPNVPVAPLFYSPLKKALLYDYPSTYQILDKLVNAYGFDKLFTPQSLPPEGKFMLTQMYKTPHWTGFYDKILNFFKPPGYPIQLTEPMFEKIREGEIWRLFTPAILHYDIFHLFFNMIWLLVLGMQMEKRLGLAKYILFMLIVAIFSNTAQYLMSGPNFVGFSGILCGMIAFVWFRQKNNPWEGYQLLPSTMGFITIFILAMFSIQLISFFLQIMGQSPIAPPIANTAHLSGALAGYSLSKSNFFAWKITN